MMMSDVYSTGFCTASYDDHCCVNERIAVNLNLVLSYACSHRLANAFFRHGADFRAMDLFSFDRLQDFSVREEGGEDNSIRIS